MANLSQAEINALLNGGPAAGGQTKEDIFEYFSADETDALGEIGNICMGASATAMSALVGRRIMITTPKVELYQSEAVLVAYKCPFLAVDVEYVCGIAGKNLLIIKDFDAAVITDLMMGGDGVVHEDNPVLDEIHLSAMSEVMNQMIGSAATAMSDMMGEAVNISPPRIFRMEANGSVGKYFGGASPVLKISFDMEIEGLLKSKLLQIMTVEAAKTLIDRLMVSSGEGQAPEPTRARGSAVKQQVRVVKPASFQSFDDQEAGLGQNTAKSNFDLINDIPLQVTVELGKAVKNLNDVLNFGTGAIIILDKQAGDLVDVIVNGKPIAKGEVVVIDENYGVRITEILKA